MKVRVLAEVITDEGIGARRLVTCSVGPRTTKLYEAMGGDDVYGFIAQDVLSNAVKAVQDGHSNDQKLTEASMTKEAVDDTGKPTGRSELDEMLGLEIIEHMNKKDQEKRL